ncbi:ketoacyl-ACP synthase III [Marinobacter shengliensis]|uniref:ketoacyl-ACP synthase III n=1 Tax=Marinobacter shengliensis TaxID=1389223 RepID=UPI000D10B63E|nr:ketoacyl-ACP synthase III [Marinobacter shengliensis]PSF12971.1 ketoacyl-ACP synthase III [Marinobacter shengliensis]
MIGIKNVASFIPEYALDNLQRVEAFGESSEFITKKIGALKLPRKDDTEETSDLAVKAIERLIEASEGFEKSSVDALIIVTQNGDGEGLPHTSAIVQQKLGLPKSIAAFDVSLGCSGYVYGLHILKGFMESAGLKNGILVTADPYSKIIDPDDKNTALLFGDAATATWLGNSPAWNIGPALFGTDGEGEGALKTSGSCLTMNGRQVFDFAAKNVAPNIKALLEKAELEDSQVDAFCIHQGSYAIVDAISRRFKGSQQKFIRDIGSTGNTVSSSIPLLLEKHVLGSDCKKVIISGFGVGFSWGTALLTKNTN